MGHDDNENGSGRLSLGLAVPGRRNFLLYRVSATNHVPITLLPVIHLPICYICMDCPPEYFYNQKVLGKEYERYK
jgi:hypothetical protein